MDRHYHLEEDESASVATVTLVARERGQVPTDLPPVQEYVEPDALDALARPDGPASPTITFDYVGYEVRITEGTISLRANDGVGDGADAGSRADEGRKNRDR